MIVEYTKTGITVEHPSGVIVEHTLADLERHKENLIAEQQEISRELTIVESIKTEISLLTLSKEP